MFSLPITVKTFALTRLLTKIYNKINCFFLLLRTVFAAGGVKVFITGGNNESCSFNCT